MLQKFVIDVDFGTDSVRSVIVNAINGDEVVSSVFNYPRWKKGLYCNPAQNQFSQRPLDHIEGLQATIMDCVKKPGIDMSSNIAVISVDTTGSTPVAIDKTGMPLALLPNLERSKCDVYFVERSYSNCRAEINGQAKKKKFDINYLQYVGGIYSSEWH